MIFNVGFEMASPRVRKNRQNDLSEEILREIVRELTPDCIIDNIHC